MKQIINEIYRQFKRPSSWAVMAFIIAVVYDNTSGVFVSLLRGRWEAWEGVDTMLGEAMRYFLPGGYTAMDTHLFYPLCNSLVFAGLGVALFVLLELDRIRRNGLKNLLDSIVDPGWQYFTRTIALLSVISVGVLLGSILLYPISKQGLGELLCLKDYAFCWFYIYYMGLIVYALIAAGIYLLSENVLAGMGSAFVLSFLLNGAEIGTLGKLASLFQWPQTRVNTLSDGSGNQWAFAVISFYRIAWILMAAAVYALGQCMVPRYGRSMDEVSFTKQKPPAMIVLGVLLLSLVIHLGSESFTISAELIDQPNYIDKATGIHVQMGPWPSLREATECTKGKVKAMLDGKRRALSMEGEFTLLSEEETTTYLRIPAGLKATEISINGQKATYADCPYIYSSDKLYFINIPKGQFCLTLSYEGVPINTYLYVDHIITERYMDIYFDYPDATKAVIDTELTMPEGLTIYGAEFNEEDGRNNGDGTVTYHTLSSGPYSILAGRYEEETVRVDGVEVTFAYFASKSEWLRSSGVKDTIRDMIKIYSDKFGPARADGQELIIAEYVSYREKYKYIGDKIVYCYPEDNLWDLDIDDRPTEISIPGIAELIAKYWWSEQVDSEEFYSWDLNGLYEYSTYVVLNELLGEDYAEAEYTERWLRELRHMANSYYYNNRKVQTALPESVDAAISRSWDQIQMKANSGVMLHRMQEYVGGQETFTKLLTQLRERAMIEKGTIKLFDIIKMTGMAPEDLVDWNPTLGRHAVRNYTDDTEGGL